MVFMCVCVFQVLLTVDESHFTAPITGPCSANAVWLVLLLSLASSILSFPLYHFFPPLSPTGYQTIVTLLFSGMMITHANEKPDTSFINTTERQSKISQEFAQHCSSLLVLKFTLYCLYFSFSCSTFSVFFLTVYLYFSTLILETDPPAANCPFVSNGFQWNLFVFVL